MAGSGSYVREGVALVVGLALVVGVVGRTTVVGVVGAAVVVDR